MDEYKHFMTIDFNDKLNNNQIQQALKKFMSIMPKGLIVCRESYEQYKILSKVKK